MLFKHQTQQKSQPVHDIAKTAFLTNQNKPFKNIELMHTKWFKINAYFLKQNVSIYLNR